MSKEKKTLANIKPKKADRWKSATCADPTDKSLIDLISERVNRALKDLNNKMWREYLNDGTGKLGEEKDE